jgi:hypothetical protein
LIAHDGGFFGAMTSLNRFTDDGLLVIVISNKYMLAYGLAAICFGKDVELPYYHQGVKNNVSLYTLFKANYEDVKTLEIRESFIIMISILNYIRNLIINSSDQMMTREPLNLLEILMENTRVLK